MNDVVLRHHSDEQFARLGLSPPVRAETSSGMSACQLVAEGIGVSLVDPIIARAIPGIAVKRWEPTNYLTYGFLFSTANALSSLTLKFGEVLRTTTMAMGPDDVSLI